MKYVRKRKERTKSILEQEGVKNMKMKFILTRKERAKMNVRVKHL